MDEVSEKELFETMPVPKAVATLAVPTIISQVVTMIYNLADTFFIGQLGNPYMVAAVSLVSPWFNLLTALGNLFGLGGSSLISRMLGVKNHQDVKHVSSFSVWGGVVITLVFSLVTWLARAPLLNFLGASSETFGYAQSYLNWVVVLGGVPTVVSLILGHLLRSEGHARQASAGMMFGGILNVVLDPVLIFGFGMGVAGAAIATAFSNAASVVFFVIQYIRLRGSTSASLHPKYFTMRFVKQVFSVGLASALATTLGNAANMVIVKLASGYGDIPVAAYGVVKKIDQFPLNVSMGLCQGFMPLVGYNYSARNYKRMRDVSVFSWKTALIMSACCIACFAGFAPQILHLFVREAQTSALGATFLRIACLAVPLTTVNFLISYTLQAMGKGVQSAILTFSRQGLLNIPLLIIMNLTLGLYGMIWTQLVIEAIMLPVSLGMYQHTLRKLRENDSGRKERQNMKQMKGVVITGKNTLAVSDSCPLPEEICPTGALIRPLIWSPCTSDAHLCATGCASLPYLLGKAVGHEMCGVITRVGSDVHDFKPGDRVIVCAVMPVWRSLEAQDGHSKNRQDNMYAGKDYPDRGGSFVEEYYIRDADMNLALIPEGVTLEQAVMVPDMMCTAFEGVRQLDTEFGASVAVLGIGPVGLMAVRAAVLHGAGKVFAIGSRQVCFDVAKAYGATHLVDYHNEDYIDQIIEANGGPVDGVVLCGGSEKELSKGLKMLKNGGTLVNLSAYFSGMPIEIDPAVWGFGYGDKTIKGVGCGGGRLWMSRMAQLIACGRVEPEKMITHRFHGMERIPEAMDLFLNHDRSLIKPVIYND